MRSVVFGPTALSIEDIVAIARRETVPSLSEDPAFAQMIESGARFLDEMIAEKGEIYGVTTGYGDSCDKKVPQCHQSCGWTFPAHMVPGWTVDCHLIRP